MGGRRQDAASASGLSVLTWYTKTHRTFSQGRCAQLALLREVGQLGSAITIEVMKNIVCQLKLWVTFEAMKEVACVSCYI